MSQSQKANVTVEINGEILNAVSSLAVYQTVNGHHSFEMFYPIKETGNSLIDFCKKKIQKGLKLEIAPFNSEQQGNSNFFRGIVTGISLYKGIGHAEQVLIKGSSPTILMEDGPHCQSFREKSLTDIVSAITNRYGENIQIEPMYTSPVPYHVQYKESSFAFLNRTANAFGEWFYYDGTQLCFGKHSAGQEIELVFGRDLMNFEVKMQLKPTHFKWLGYNPENHQYAEALTTSLNVNELDEYGNITLQASEALFVQTPTIPVHYQIKTKKELDQTAQIRRHVAASDMVYFIGKSSNIKLQVGATIKIKSAYEGGLADYGSFTLLEVNHHISSGDNYFNDFIAIPANLVNPPAHKSIVQPICEPQVAEVIDNHDPESMARLKVQLPWQKAFGDTTPWIRVISSSGGGSHGFYFMPEIGDQVLVGFEYNDPNLPYVIGAMYHGGAKPKDVSDASNNKKVIKTKSGNQIALNDEKGKEEIKLTNGSNMITMSLDGSGKISITTAGDLELKGKKVSITAEEDLEVTAGKKTTITSKEDTAISVTTGKLTIASKSTLEVTTSDSATIHANSTLTLAADADTTISGKNTNILGEVSAKVESVNAEVSGTSININANADLTANGGITQVNGSVVKLN